MSSKLHLDYLKNHPEYKVYQHADMYHFNTDTCLLGEYLKINKDEKVLDVGTNNGALLVYIINKGGIATGIEINQEALKVCKLTLQENNLSATLINIDFKDYQSKELFDVIVSNPPFFDNLEEKELSQNENKRIARHEANLSLNDLAKSLKNNLSPKGRIYLVYRPNRLDELESKLNESGLFINELCYVNNQVKSQPVSVLLETSFSKKEKKVKQIVIDNQGNII